MKRRATEIIAELRHIREPVLITEHGRSMAILMDIATCEELERRLAVLEGIARGERAIAEGRVVAHGSAKERLVRWRKRDDSV